ncbi:MAG: diguanylate cyclase [Eubacterium sp.]|nr:diguanylate cyclase [Eubacterium sp.]
MKKKSKLRSTMLRATLWPVILLGIAIIICGVKQTESSIYQEVESGLKSVAQMTMYLYEQTYPGEYQYDSKEKVLYKGEKKIEGAFHFFEQYKECSGTDITIFYKDMRVISTVKDSKGNSIVGTLCNSVIKQDVYDKETAHFYTKSKVGDENYFSYYAPLYDERDQCVGMVFAGKPSAYVNQIVWKSALPILLLVLLSMILLVFVIWNYTDHLNTAFRQLQRFLKNVEGGDFAVEMSESLTKRKDELGQMAQSAISMQHSLRELVQRDSLTGLYNRHYGEVWLKQVKEESDVTGEPFSVAIADIDFFKKFNDQYGHDCGDMVLRKVSEVLQNQIGRKGYVARWGGEEFLIIFKALSLPEAVQFAEEIRQVVCNSKMTYQEKQFHVTITVGVAKGDSKKSQDEILKKADCALYFGKENGRNQVVSESEDKTLVETTSKV